MEAEKLSIRPSGKCPQEQVVTGLQLKPFLCKLQLQIPLIGPLYYLDLLVSTQRFFVLIPECSLNHTDQELSLFDFVIFCYSWIK